METFHAWSKAIPTFFFVQSRMRVLILDWSVGRIEPPQKKLQKNLQRNHKKHWNGRPWYPRNTLKVNINIFGLKNTQFLFLFLSFSMLLICSFFRLKELFQVKNGSTTTLLFFFLENAKNLGRSDDAKRRKKTRGWPNAQKYHIKLNINQGKI